MEKEALHHHIADILERIAHLNRSLEGTSKVLPVEVDLLKGYMAELDKSFDALILDEPVVEKTSIINEEENIEVEAAREMESSPLDHKADLQTQTAPEEELGEEIAVEANEVGSEEPLGHATEELAEEEVTESIVIDGAVVEPVIEQQEAELIEEAVEEEVVVETFSEEVDTPSPEPVMMEEPEPIAEEEVVEPPREEVLSAEETIQKEEPIKQDYFAEDAEGEEGPEQPTAKGAASLNERFSKRDGVELGYKIKTPTQSLKAMIDLSEKYVYTKELFGGDKDHFESTLKYLDQCHSLSEANTHINEVVKPRFKWDDKVEVEKRFRGLLQQRFN